jgi:hypothetical protein
MFQNINLQKFHTPFTEVAIALMERESPISRPTADGFWNITDGHAERSSMATASGKDDLYIV